LAAWPVVLVFSAPAPTFVPASMTFSLEARASLGGIVQGIDLYDWVAGSWVTVDLRPAAPLDQVVSIPLANPGRFVERRTRAMNAQVRFRALGPRPAGGWDASIDAVAWTVR
jgi:hypothetical protein